MVTSTKWLSESTYASATGPSLAELLAPLQQLNRLLEHAVAAAQVAHGPEAIADPYCGLHIGQEEVKRYYRATRGHPCCGQSGPRLRSPPDLAGDGPRLAWLKQAFDLSAFDVDVLLLAFAPELDPRYERLYAYLQDDMTKKRPTINLQTIS
jgi:hypothetical protein